MRLYWAMVMINGGKVARDSSASCQFRLKSTMMTVVKTMAKLAMFSKPRPVNRRTSAPRPITRPT